MDTSDLLLIEEHSVGDLSSCIHGADNLTRLADSKCLLQTELQEARNASVAQETKLQVDIT
jgi:hypothetical protein